MLSPFFGPSAKCPTLYFCLCVQDPQNLTYSSICTKTVAGKKYCLVVRLPSPGEVCKKNNNNFQETMSYGQILSLPVLSRMWNTSDLEWKKELPSFLWDPLIKIFVGFDRIFSNCFSQQCINIVRKEVKYQCPKSS